MDITRPPLEQQAGPRMDRVIRRNVDPVDLVRQAVAENPNATADQVTEMLRQKGYPVSGVWVAVCMRQLRRPK